MTICGTKPFIFHSRIKHQVCRKPKESKPIAQTPGSATSSCNSTSSPPPCLTLELLTSLEQENLWKTLLWASRLLTLNSAPHKPQQLLHTQLRRPAMSHQICEGKGEQHPLTAYQLCAHPAHNPPSPCVKNQCNGLDHPDLRQRRPTEVSDAAMAFHWNQKNPGYAQTSAYWYFSTRCLWSWILACKWQYFLS